LETFDENDVVVFDRYYCSFIMLALLSLHGLHVACLTMVFKLVRCAETHWRRLNGAALLPQVIQGVTFVDGLKKEAA
jgi:hypothetical protein